MIHFHSGNFTNRTIYDLSPTFFDVQGAAFEESRRAGPFQRMHDVVDFETAGEGNLPFLSPEEIDSRAREAGVSVQDFPDTPMNEKQLELLIKRRKAQRRRQTILSIGDAGFFETLPASILGEMADPIWLGADVMTAGAFTKYRGAAKGVVGLARRGAAEGAIATAATEPFTHYLSDRLADRYTATDSLLSIGMGTLAGGVLSAGFGTIGSWLRRGEDIHGNIKNLTDEDKKRLEELTQIDKELTDLQLGLFSGRQKNLSTQRIKDLLRKKGKILDDMGFKNLKQVDVTMTARGPAVLSALHNGDIVTYKRGKKRLRIIGQSADYDRPFIDETGNTVSLAEMGAVNIRTRGDAVRAKKIKEKKTTRYVLTSLDGKELPRPRKFMGKTIVAHPNELGPSPSQSGAKSFATMPAKFRKAMMAKAIKQQKRGQRVNVTAIEANHWDDAVRRLHDIDSKLDQFRKLQTEMSTYHVDNIKRIRDLEARRESILTEIDGNDRDIRRASLEGGENLTDELQKAYERGAVVEVRMPGEGVERAYFYDGKRLYTERGQIGVKELNKALKSGDAVAVVTERPNPISLRPKVRPNIVEAIKEEIEQPTIEAEKRIEEIKKEQEAAGKRHSKEIYENEDIAAIDKYRREIEQENKTIEELWTCING